MAMQYDVKSTHLNASGSVYAARARVKGIYVVSGATTGSLKLHDGTTTGGITLIELDTSAQTNPIPDYLLIPGEGVLFENAIYAEITGGIASVTIFYG